MEPCLNKTQLRRMGWTPRLILLLLGKPDYVEPKMCLAGRYRCMEHLFAAARVSVAMHDPRYVAAAERRKARQAARGLAVAGG